MSQGPIAWYLPKAAHTHAGSSSTTSLVRFPLIGERFMRWGILLAALGVACYIAHTILLNASLRKNVPEMLAHDPHAPSQRQRRVYLVGGVTPRWVTLLGLPALPLFLLGIVLMAVSCFVNVLR